MSDFSVQPLATGDFKVALADDHEALTFHPLAPAGGIGDIRSSAKGSGARYNAGKPPIELIPLKLIAEDYLRRNAMTTAQTEAAKALHAIGQYQARERGVEALYEAISRLGVGGWHECAMVFDYGRRKYAEFNWAKGMPWSVPIACAGRHIFYGILAGEAKDVESGFAHRGHVFCNVVMLLTYAETYPEGDDRPAAGLLSKAAK